MTKSWMMLFLIVGIFAFSQQDEDRLIFGIVTDGNEPYLENIDRVAIISGLTATSKYGSIAAGGVVIINTKNSIIVKEPGTDEPFDRAKIRNNLYANDAVDSTDILKNAATYLKDLYSSENLTDAKSKYEFYLKSLGSNPYFIVDAYLYFAENGGKKYALEIFHSNFDKFDNPVHAKAMAYALDVTNETILSNLLYKKILAWRPHYSQSYRDLANNYRQNNEFGKSVSMYSRYLYLVKEGLFKNDKNTIKTIVKRELKNLLSSRDIKIPKGSEFISSQERASKTGGTSFLFEWNDSEAEFELQFVNPTNRYFAWDHSYSKIPERIKDEKLQGYSSEEFYTDNSFPGVWQINATYKGNKKRSATYLKLTVYQKYGQKDQTSTSKIYKFRLRDVNQELIRLNI